MCPAGIQVKTQQGRDKYVHFHNPSGMLKRKVVVSAVEVHASFLKASG